MSTNLSILKIHVKNFKSLTDATLDLQSKAMVPKKLCIIYGPNGSGKSSIIESVMALTESYRTLQAQDMLSEYLNTLKDDDTRKLPPEFLNYFFKSRLGDQEISTFIQRYKSAQNKTDSMLLEYHFLIDGSPAYYMMEFSNESIIRERLEYRLRKNKGVFFDIDTNGSSLTKSVFIGEKTIEALTDDINMYWGKHTLLAILVNNLRRKTKKYVIENYAKNLLLFIDAIRSFGIICDKEEHSAFISYRRDQEYLTELVNGEIDGDQEEELHSMGEKLSMLIHSMMPDIQDVHYETTPKGEKVSYKLFENKIIDGGIVSLPFSLESSGNIEILKILPYILQAISGKCILIDEYGSKMHHLIACNLLSDLIESNLLFGQIIITTHNLLLLNEKELPVDSFYFILEDDNFTRKISCASEIEPRLYANYNYFLRYLQNDIYRQALPKEMKDFDPQEMAKLYL